jgi:hypothetical protein
MGEMSDELAKAFILNLYPGPIEFQSRTKNQNIPGHQGEREKREKTGKEK